MQAPKEKVKNTASAVQEHVDIYKAKVEEKVEKSHARTEKEKEIAHEHRKAKEAEAKMLYHEAKVQHRAEREDAKLGHELGVHNPRHFHEFPGGITTNYPAASAIPGSATTGPAASSSLEVSPPIIRPHQLFLGLPLLDLLPRVTPQLDRPANNTQVQVLLRVPLLQDPLPQGIQLPDRFLQPSTSR